MTRRLKIELALAGTLVAGEALRRLQVSVLRERIHATESDRDAASRMRAVAQRRARTEAEGHARWRDEATRRGERVVRLGAELELGRARERELNERLRELVFRAERMRDELASFTLSCKVPGGTTIPAPATPELDLESAATLAYVAYMGTAPIDKPEGGWDSLALLVRFGLVTTRACVYPNKVWVTATREGRAFARNLGLDALLLDRHIPSEEVLAWPLR